MSQTTKAIQKPVSLVTPAIAQKPWAVIPSFDLMADTALIREAQLVQSPKRPGVPAPLPFSGPTLWRKVAAGTFPRPLKLSARVTAWRVGDVRGWLNALTV
jgi:predicted DNA-binding transcriptional regulator AlpA